MENGNFGSKVRIRRYTRVNKLSKSENSDKEPTLKSTHIKEPMLQKNRLNVPIIALSGEDLSRILKTFRL